MLRKRFSLRESKVKSRFVFRLSGYNHEGHEVRKPFRDRSALPVLEKLVDALRSRGYDVTIPERGKACDGYFRVTFSSVVVVAVMLVEHADGTVEFSLCSWPYQSF